MAPRRVVREDQWRTALLWQAVNQEGEVLESFDAKTHDRKAALKFLRRLIKWHNRPHVFVTDKLRSYEAALNELGVANPLEIGRWLNNRAENSHLPFQRRERAMLGFRRMRSLQNFASVHSSVHNHFNQDHHLYSRENFKLNRSAIVAEWRKLLFRKSSRILRET